MAHTPAEKLKVRLAEAQAKVEVGARYAHYKHPELPYRILAIALTEENEEPAVVYQQEQGEKLTFIRPLESFLATVETESGTVPRFSKV